MLFCHEKNPLLVLAPMSGVTDLPFLRMVKRFSQDVLVISEMIASQAMVRQIRKSLKRGQFDEKGSEVVQIAGNDPDTMAQAARLAQDMGAWAVDINIGCPAKKLRLIVMPGRR